MIVVEHLARHRGAGGLAAAGEQRLAELDQAIRVVPAVARIGAAQPIAASLGNRRKQLGKERVGHGPIRRADRISMKRTVLSIYGGSGHNQATAACPDYPFSRAPAIICSAYLPRIPSASGG